MRITDEFENTIEIERSTFICHLKKIFSEQEARDFILKIQKKHPNANHHCTAFISGNNHELQRCNDDREPSGTAGIPMLSALKNSGVTDVCAVVVRYFGGIKLGAGGLVRAYSTSVSEALHKASKVETFLVDVYQLSFSYDLIGKLDYLLKDDCTITDKKYEEQVHYYFFTQNKDICTLIQECTSGKYIPNFIESKIIEIPI